MLSPASDFIRLPRRLSCTIVPVERLTQWLERGCPVDALIERSRTVARARAIASLCFATRAALAPGVPDTFKH